MRECQLERTAAVSMGCGWGDKWIVRMMDEVAQTNLYPFLVAGWRNKWMEGMNG